MLLVALEPLTLVPDITLEQYSAAAEEQLRRIFPDYTPVSQESVVLAGLPAYRQVFRAKGGGGTWQGALYYALDRGTAHVLHCGTSAALYAALEPTCDAIAGSYEVTR